MKQESGFSLVELLVVVAILTIIFGIAVPYYFSTKGGAEAASAMADLKTIHSAQLSYYSGPGAGTYGTFPQLETQKLLSAGFSTGDYTYKRFNYSGTLTLSDANRVFTILCNPTTINHQTPSYFIDESGAVRYSTTGNATSSSTPIGQ